MWTSNNDFIKHCNLILEFLVKVYGRNTIKADWLTSFPPLQSYRLLFPLE